MLNNNCDRRVMTKVLMRRDLEKMGFPNPPLDNFKEYEHGEYFMRGLYPYPYEVIIETRQGYATLGRFKHRTQAERLFRKILKLFK